MTNIKWLLCALFLTALFGREAKANTQTAASCNTSDVQRAINSAAAGDTVIIPAGTCTWTSGVSFSGINVKGQGSGRIIAYDNGAETLNVATGTQTLTIAGYSPGFSAASITNGETLQVFPTNAEAYWMQGTVTSLVSGVLTMNITSIGTAVTGVHRWNIATISSTVIVNNQASDPNAGPPLFNITESTTVNTSLSGIRVTQNTGTGPTIFMNYVSASGQAILIHDNWFDLTGNASVIDAATSRGVIWNNSFTGNTANTQMVNSAALGCKMDSPASGQNAWILPSYWGSLDTTGLYNIYFETNDVHAIQNAANSDSNCRMVWRYNLMDHAEHGSHGADSSNYGQRYFEFYDNTGVFYGYSTPGSCTDNETDILNCTLNMANGWSGGVRGGTFVWHDNTLPAISSGDYGTRPDIELEVQNLAYNRGPDPCWGAGYTTHGQYYYAPRQVGTGRVTGTGTANYPPDGVNNSSTDSITYVGDSEPIYIWNNSRTQTLNLLDSTPSACTNNDLIAYYAVSGRDYFNGTAKPSYTPYTYPHPLTLGQTSGNPPAPPTGLTASVQ